MMICSKNSLSKTLGTAMMEKTKASTNLTSASHEMNDTASNILETTNKLNSLAKGASKLLLLPKIDAGSNGNTVTDNAIKGSLQMQIIKCDEIIKDANVQMDLTYMKQRDIETSMLRGKDPSTDQQWEHYKSLEELMGFAMEMVVACKKVIKRNQ